MTSLHVHPEHLLDGSVKGELGDAEQAQLNAHLAKCAACRLELGVAQVLMHDIKASSRAKYRAQGSAPDPAVEGALSAMLAVQMLRVPALRTLPVTHFRVRRRLGQRIFVAGLLFLLGAAAAVIVMRQLDKQRDVGAEEVPAQ